MYYDEDLLLDLRLNELNPYVEKFVIAEATYTHNGNKKNLQYVLLYRCNIFGMFVQI